MKNMIKNKDKIDVRDFIESLKLERWEDIIILDGLDDAFVGVKIGKLPKAIYSKDKIIEILMNDMNYTDAIEYFDFNIGCAYFGKQTPIIA